METYQEKSDDPSNHYGGISRGAMNEIKDCIDALLAAVQNSEEYQEFEKYRDLLKENPELMDRVNAFRGNNFRLQNEANRDELFRGTEQLNRESRELRSARVIWIPLFCIVQFYRYAPVFSYHI